VPLRATLNSSPKSARFCSIQVVFFRDQDITRAEHVAFARHSATQDHPVAGAIPTIRLVRTTRPGRACRPLRERVHTDATWAREAALGCVLRCVECPPVGGDTMWANMGEAYKRPPEQARRRSPACARGTASKRASVRRCRRKRLALHAQFPDAEHPVVRTHPETGEKILFVNAFTTHLTNYHTPANVRFGQDASPGASQLLNYLISQAFVPEFQVRFRWKPNSMAFWDNRRTQH
jgi:taurine dioxygenase